MITSRRAPVPPAVTIRPPLPERANATTPRSISSASRTPTGVSSTPSECAPDCTAANWPVPDTMVALRKTATRAMPGAICLSNSIHLPLKLYSKLMKPVALPPGRARLCTHPAPTGSGTLIITIGMVRVACSTGVGATLPTVTITSGASATNSAACRRMDSGSRSEEHTSELQSLRHLVCRLLLEKKKKHNKHKEGGIVKGKVNRQAIIQFREHINIQSHQSGGVRVVELQSRLYREGWLSGQFTTD